jgi:hypothetical protein
VNAPAPTFDESLRHIKFEPDQPIVLQSTSPYALPASTPPPRSSMATSPSINGINGHSGVNGLSNGLEGERHRSIVAC